MNETVPSPQMPTKGSSKGALAAIFLTVFLDLVGFGIVIPLSPYLARLYHATPTQVGALLAIYSVFQFLFSPLWGSLSDRVGRRPVLLICIAGGGLSYLLFAFAQSLWLLFIARALAGLFGGNISTAHAYIADVTSKEDRSKGMGMIGAAFGLGFIFGPLIGAGLGILGQNLGSVPPLGMSFSALGAAILCFINFGLAWWRLRESRAPENDRGQRKAKRKRNRWREIRAQLARPHVGSLMIVFFLSGLAMAQMESMLFPYVADVFHWDLRTASLGFAYVGVMMVFTQGFLIRKLMPVWGERRVLKLGLFGFALSLVLIPLSTTIAAMAVVMTILALGNGMMRPPNIGLISVLTPADEQGLALGVTNSLASLGRILGPVLGGFLYEQVGRGAPFFFAGGLAMTALVLVLKISEEQPLEHRSTRS
jgi:MFS family permease